MKDYVFIGWSRNRDLAIAVKRILDQKGFVCVIGGVYEGNPQDMGLRTRKGTVNETVNYQMNHCDQSIMLFQKIDDNLGISGNLIYELGYICAQYSYIDSTSKLHIFKIDITQAEENLFPSDLHGIWGTEITSCGKAIEEIAVEIANEFLNNQCQIKKESKFNILNEHHHVGYEIKKHFETPAMSDYDLASRMLVYLQSAFCYQQQNDIMTKLERFKSELVRKDSHSIELKWAVDYALLTLELFGKTMQDDENVKSSMPGAIFREMFNNYKLIGEDIAEHFENDFDTTDLAKLRITSEFEDMNDFEALLISQMQGHVSYLILVYLFDTALDKEEVEYYANQGIAYCKAAIENLELLAKKEENKMYAKLQLSYEYKNLSTFYAQVGDIESSNKNQRKSLKIRHELYAYVNGIDMFRPSLKDYITLEYLLQAVDIIKTSNDKYEKADYMSEIKKYIDKRKEFEQNRMFVFNMLVEEYNKLCEENNT